MGRGLRRAGKKCLFAIVVCSAALAGCGGAVEKPGFSDPTPTPTPTASPTPTPTTTRLSLSPTSVGFGSVTAGTSRTRNVTVSNTGNAQVQLTAVNVTGSGFTVSGPQLPVTIATGANRVFTLEFAPEQSGPHSATVTFVSNAASSPNTLRATGTGVAAGAHSVDLDWNASTSSIAGYRIYRRTASSSYQALNSTLEAGTAYTDDSVQPGATYYYVVTAVTVGGAESVYSNQVTAVIPNP